MTNGLNLLEWKSPLGIEGLTLTLTNYYFELWLSCEFPIYTVVAYWTVAQTLSHDFKWRESLCKMGYQRIENALE